jgi:hypothetical protein
MGLEPIGPIGPTGPPALLTRTSSGLGRLTDPTQPPHSPLSPLELSGDNWIAATADWSLRPTPVIFVVAAWGKMIASTSSTNSSSWNLRGLPLRGDLGGFPPRDPPSPNAPDAVPRRAGACWACWATSGAWAARVPASRCTMVWCSWCVLDEVFPRQPLAGRAGTALPCHPDEHLGVGECDSPLSNLLLLSLAMVSDLLVKISEPSSQTLLCDAVAWC